MVTYECKRCKKLFFHLGDYNRHLNRKNQCKIVVIEKDKQKDKQKDNKFKCNECDKTYKHLPSLSRHKALFHRLILAHNLCKRRETNMVLYAHHQKERVHNNYFLQ